MSLLVVGLRIIVPLVRAQEAAQSEREAMYYRYLEFPSYVKGGSIEPHWLADGSSFWYAEGAPANTVIWKVDPKANTKTLLIHGTSDRVVPFSETMKMVGALIRTNKPYDLIVLPEFRHLYDGTSKTYWLEAIRRYFQEHLQSQEFCKGDISSPRKLVEKSR